MNDLVSHLNQQLPEALRLLEQMVVLWSISARLWAISDGLALIHKDASHNDHWMRAENVHYHRGSEPGQIVRATNSIVVLRQDKVQPGFVFDDVTNSGSILQRPLHVCYQLLNSR